MSGWDLDERLQGFTPLPDAQKAVAVPSKPPLAQLSKVQTILKAAEQALEGRVLLRYSGTEPKLRILVEATEREEAQRWCVRLEEAILSEFS